MRKLIDLDLPIRHRTIGNVIRQRAEALGDKIYLIWRDRHYSYRELDDITDRLADGLTRLGVKKGMIVGFLCENSAELLFSYFALGKIGAVALPLNTAVQAAQFDYFLGAFDVGLLFVDADLTDVLNRSAIAAGSLRSVVVMGAEALPAIDAIPVRSYASLLDSPATIEVEAPRFNDLAHIPYTSGTTGLSKGNLQTHSGLLSGAVAYCEYLGFREDDVLYTCLPLFHMSAYGNCLQALLAGATVALAERFSASRFWADVRRVNATILTSVGAMTSFLWSQESTPNDAMNDVRLFVMIPVMPFARQFSNRFGVHVVSCYGMSDFGPLTFLQQDDEGTKLNSAGRVRNDLEIAILDEDDFAVSRGTPGEICVRSREPWVGAIGYHKMSDATVRSRMNFWFHTGDYGYLDEDDFLYFAGRKKDAIRRRGENISAHEVEEVLMLHEAVSNAAVYGVPSEHGEEEVAATILLADQSSEISPETIIDHCIGKLPYFMVPRYLEFVSDLPRTATEKVDKKLLRDQAVGRLSSLWDRESHGIVLTRTRLRATSQDNRP